MGDDREISTGATGKGRLPVPAPIADVRWAGEAKYRFETDGRRVVLVKFDPDATVTLQVEGADEIREVELHNLNGGGDGTSAGRSVVFKFAGGAARGFEVKPQ